MNDGQTRPAADKVAIQTLMQGGRMADALAVLREQLQQAPGDGEALYLAAVCARYLRDFDSAEAWLRQRLDQSPEDGRALQELAHLYRDRGLPEQAIASYEQAVRANPALIASFENQLKLQRQLGRDSDAAVTQARLEQARALPRALLAVTDLLAQGRIVKAEELCRGFLQQNPRHTEGMRLLADIGSRFGALDEAQFLLETACELAPTDPRLRIELIRVLGKRQRFEESLAQAETLLASSPANLQYQSLRAIELLQLGRYAEAIDGFDAILSRLPEDAVTLTSRGHALKTRGDTADAIASYEAASAAPQGNGEAWYALANLKTYRFSDAQIDSMRRRLDARAPLMDEVYLCFALGKAFEDREAYDESFRHYERGNRRKRSQLAYRRETFRAEVDAQITHMTSDVFAHHRNAGFDAPDPIFILGMPRAGSTLLEQILASHSQIDGTRELPNVLSLSQRLRRHRGAGGEQPGYPQVLGQLDSGTLRDLGRAYIEDTQIHRGTAPFFIDKMPNNFRHIGLIQLMLPRARIIDARREPMACCFSNFKQLFAEGQEFSYDLDDLGHYYRDYERLMAHWDSVLPGRVYRLQHERLLDDIEGELRDLFSYLELPFEEQCLRFHESARPVRTPSSEQVRQPLFHDAVQQWQNYAPWLSPLRDALDGSVS